MLNSSQIDSPCTGVCQYDQNTQLCKGCFRNKEEIVLWRCSGDDRKSQILTAVKERKKLTDFLYTKDMLSHIICLTNKIDRVVSFSSSCSYLLINLELDCTIISNPSYTDLSALKPDLILMDSKYSYFDSIKQKFSNIWLCDVHNIKDALKLTKRLSKLLAAEDRASYIIKKIKAVSNPKNDSSLSTCLCVLDPGKMEVVSSKNFVNFSLESKGFINILKDTNTVQRLSKSTLLELKPEYVFLSSDVVFQNKKDLLHLENQFKDISFMPLDSKMCDWYDFILN